MKVADWNPISSIVLAIRDFWGNSAVGPARGHGFPAHHALLLSVLWIVAIVVVFLPLSINKYRRAATR